MSNLDNLLAHKLIEIDDIPNIDLYMDQVTGYLENVLHNLKVDEEDKILTKTMINNYVKGKVISKPIKKKYNKNQLMELIMIYHLKNVVTLSEIDELFTLQGLKFNEGENEGSDDSILENSNIKEAYTDFLKIQEQVLQQCNLDFQENTQKLTGDNKSETLKYVLKLILEADLNKRLAELILKNMSDDKA